MMPGGVKEFRMVPSDQRVPWLHALLCGGTPIRREHRFHSHDRNDADLVALIRWTECERCGATWDVRYEYSGAADQYSESPIDRARRATQLRDRQRLDWLNAHAERVEWVNPDSDASACILSYRTLDEVLSGEDTPLHEAAGDSIREAIDAGMQETLGVTP